MRKLFALAMVALLAMTVALAVVGCGQKAEEATPPAAEQTMPADTAASMPMDSTAVDTMAH